MNSIELMTLKDMDRVEVVNMNYSTLALRSVPARPLPNLLKHVLLTNLVVVLTSSNIDNGGNR